MIMRYNWKIKNSCWSDAFLPIHSFSSIMDYLLRVIVQHRILCCLNSKWWCVWGIWGDIILFWILFLKWLLFIICGCAGSLLLCVGLVAARGAPLPCAVRASHCGGFSCCGAQALGHAGFSSCTWAPKCKLSSCAPQHGGSSQTRDRAGIPYITRWILNHWTTREAPSFFLESSKKWKWKWSRSIVSNCLWPHRL